MLNVNLIFWTGGGGYGNFGDRLSKVIVENLIEKTKYKLVFNKTNENINLVGCGSVLQFAKDNYYIYGSGLRNFHQPKNYTKLKVYAVRGPITRQYLQDYHNISCPTVYGDPALLISTFYEPKNIDHLNDQIGIVPHHSKFANHKKGKYHIINPCGYWKDVLDQIYSCKYIISSSLHGLICSDAYDKPNLWLDENIECGPIKFLDYFSSQGRVGKKITSIHHFNEDLLYRGGNRIDLNVLKNAFPFK